MRSVCVAALLLLFGAPIGPRPAGEGPWIELERGLELGVFESPQPSSRGDSLIRVLRIDPEHFELRLLNASAPGEGQLLTARGWCERHELVAAINASLYATDYRTAVSLMRTRSHVNNRRLSKDRAVLAFDRLDESVPPVQIIDRQHQDFGELRGHYGTLVQSIRMVSLTGRNVWQQQPAKWNTAAIGMDTHGRVLFLVGSSPWSTHDFIDILLALPIGLKNALYVEGGPPAQLFVQAGGRELELVGERVNPAGGARARPLPNVIGVARR